MCIWSYMILLTVRIKLINNFALTKYWCGYIIILLYMVDIWLHGITNLLFLFSWMATWNIWFYLIPETDKKSMAILMYGFGLGVTGAAISTVAVSTYITLTNINFTRLERKKRDSYYISEPVMMFISMVQIYCYICNDMWLH